MRFQNKRLINILILFFVGASTLNLFGCSAKPSEADARKVFEHGIGKVTNVKSFKKGVISVSSG